MHFSVLRLCTWLLPFSEPVPSLQVGLRLGFLHLSTAFIYSELELVHYLQTYGFLKVKKRVKSWPGNLKQILSEVSQDCNKWIAVRSNLSLCCADQILLVACSGSLGSWSTWVQWMVFGVGHWSGLFVWMPLGIGSCDSVGTPGIGWKMQSVFWFCLYSISHISVFINVNLKSLCF